MLRASQFKSSTPSLSRVLLRSTTTVPRSHKLYRTKKTNLDIFFEDPSLSTREPLYKTSNFFTSDPSYYDESLQGDKHYKRKHFEDAILSYTRAIDASIRNRNIQQQLRATVQKLKCIFACRLLGQEPIEELEFVYANTTPNDLYYHVAKAIQICIAAHKPELQYLSLQYNLDPEPSILFFHDKKEKIFYMDNFQEIEFVLLHTKQILLERSGQEMVNEMYAYAERNPTNSFAWTCSSAVDMLQCQPVIDGEEFEEPLGLSYLYLANRAYYSVLKAKESMTFSNKYTYSPAFQVNLAWTIARACHVYAVLVDQFPHFKNHKSHDMSLQMITTPPAEKAIEYYTEALQVEHGYFNHYVFAPILHRGQMYMHMQQWNKAIKDLTRVEMNHKIMTDEKISLYSRLAHCYWALDDYKSTVEYVTKIIQVEPKFTWVHKRAQLHMAVKNFDQAIDDLTLLTKSKSQEKVISVLMQRGDCYQEKKQETLAKKDFQSALALAKENNFSEMVSQIEAYLN